MKFDRCSGGIERSARSGFRLGSLPAAGFGSGLIEALADNWAERPEEAAILARLAFFRGLLIGMSLFSNADAEAFGQGTVAFGGVFGDVAQQAFALADHHQ